MNDNEPITDDKHRVVARLLRQPVCSKCGSVIVKLDGKYTLKVISDSHYLRCRREDCEMMVDRG